MSRSGLEYLNHILEEIQYLTDHARDLAKEQFVADETLKRAFVRSLEIIGEAAKHVPEELRNKHANIEWRAMAGIRDRLIHGYFGVDYDIVWDVVRNKLPGIQKEISQIVKREGRDR